MRRFFNYIIFCLLILLLNNCSVYSLEENYFYSINNELFIWKDGDSQKLTIYHNDNPLQVKSELAISPDRKKVAFFYQDYNSRKKLDNDKYLYNINLFIYNFEEKSAVLLKQFSKELDESENMILSNSLNSTLKFVTFSPENDRLIYITNNAIWEYNLITGEDKRLYNKSDILYDSLKVISLIDNYLLLKSMGYSYYESYLFQYSTTGLIKVTDELYSSMDVINNPIGFFSDRAILFFISGIDKHKPGYYKYDIQSKTLNSIKLKDNNNNSTIAKFLQHNQKMYILVKDHKNYIIFMINEESQLKSVAKLPEGRGVNDFTISGDYIFYQDNSKSLYAYNIKNKKEILIHALDERKTIILPQKIVIDKQIAAHSGITYLTPTVNNLRFRATPTLDGPFIRHLKAGERLELIQRGKSETIGDAKGTWVKVKTVQGEVGWCFDAYLQEVK